jgi:hypothetical protein
VVGGILRRERGRAGGGDENAEENASEHADVRVVE